MPQVNRSTPSKNHIQSVVFNKKFWNETQSKEWLTNHKLFTDGIDINETQIRARQYNPSDSFKYVSKIIEKKEGEYSVMFILAIPKKSKKILFGDLKKCLERYGLIDESIKDDVEVDRKALFEPVETKDGEVVTDSPGTVISKINSVVVDIDGEIILPSGANLSLFQKNPIILYNHDYSGKPIGKAIGLIQSNVNIVANMQMAPTEEGQEIYTLLKGGFLRGMSVGFIKQEYYEPGDKGWSELVASISSFYPDVINSLKNLKRIVTKWLLLENSVCLIPANPDCMYEAMKSHKINVTDKLRDLLGIDTKSYNLKDFGYFDPNERFIKVLPNSSLDQKEINLLVKEEIARRNGKCTIDL